MEENTEQRIDLTLFSEKIQGLKERIASVIVGQEQTVDLVLTAILANGHVLIEGVPGVAKTLLARLTARLIDADFSRIQFTPDLMPSDVLGTTVFNMKTNEFDFHKGPIFADIVLVDEINRAPAKTQENKRQSGRNNPQVLDGIGRNMIFEFIDAYDRFCKYKKECAPTDGNNQSNRDVMRCETAGIFLALRTDGLSDTHFRSHLI